jgi:hypothetical protein
MEKAFNQSEIARLLSQIEAEYIAAQHGLSGLAATAKHAAITARMEHLGRFHENLQAIVGAEAMRLIAERLNTISPDERGTDVLCDVRHAPACGKPGWHWLPGLQAQASGEQENKREAHLRKLLLSLRESLSSE